MGQPLGQFESDRFEIHTAQMQVQDFTVIRISPIVYNDRDILRVISYSPKLGAQNPPTASHAFSCKQFLYKHTHTQTAHLEQRQSISTHHSAKCSQAEHMAFLSKNNKRLQHRFAVLLFSDSVCLISHKASSNVPSNYYLCIACI